MSLFRSIVFIAALSGLIAGLTLTAVQHVSTVPLILKAETFEKKAPPATTHTHQDGTTHSHAAWEPADGAERIAYTTLANVVGAIGLALLLVALSEAAGGIGGWRQGVFWGLAGFAAFTLAPGLGLPPELPGMPAADLIARQIWWIAAVVLTAAGLAFLTLQKSLAGAALGLALMLAPHLVGAPKPENFETSVPHGLAHDFVVAVVISNLVFWVLLGGCVGFIRTRFAPTPV